MAITEHRARPPLGNFARTLRIAVQCVEADLRLAADPRAAVVAPPSSAELLEQVRPPLVFARLFAVVTAAAAGGSPHKAMPVSVLSSLWWAGLETGTSATAARLPLRHLRSLDITEDLRRGWSTDLEETIDPRSGVRSGAYARDAFMAARTCAPSDGPRWREFGRLYGLLADQAAANSAGGSRTPPLLLASACRVASTHRRQHLVRLGEEAGGNADARAALRDLSSAPDAVRLYDHEVRDVHARTVRTLADLCEANPYRTFLRSRVDGLLQHSLVHPREMVGSPGPRRTAAP